jgi:hypothetical protein
MEKPPNLGRGFFITSLRLVGNPLRLLALDRIERHRNVFLSGAEKTANPDSEGVDSAFLVYKYVDISPILLSEGS